MVEVVVVVVEEVVEVVDTLPCHWEHPEKVENHLQVVYKECCRAYSRFLLLQQVPI